MEIVWNYLREESYSEVINAFKVCNNVLMTSISLLLPKERVKAGNYFIDVRRSLYKNARQTIVLLHGIGVSGTYFLPFAEILSQKYDVRILDMPGYGKTPRPPHALSPSELADIVADYLRDTKVSQAVIVGQSMGCQTSAQFAIRYPALCKKLILIGPTVNRWERNLFVQAMRLLQDTLHESIKVNIIIFSDYLRMGVFRYLKTSKYMIADRIDEYASKIPVSVLIIRGSKDKIVPYRWVSYLADQMKRAIVVEIADAPHVVQFIKPKELYLKCEDFLEN
jgi:pimeloyl-ACP methyl ester carboxylesterase